MLPRFVRTQVAGGEVGPQEHTSLIDSIQDTFDTITPKELIDGHLIEDLLLISTADNVINHKLGRKLRGYFVVRKDAPLFEFVATMSGNQSIPTGAYTKLAFNGESLDYDNDFDVADYQAVIPADGLYKFEGQVEVAAPLANLSFALVIFSNNGTLLSANTICQNDAGYGPILNVDWEGHLFAGDKVGLWCIHDLGVNHNVLGPAVNYFTGRSVDKPLQDRQLTNTTPDKTLILRASVEQTVSLWVF